MGFKLTIDNNPFNTVRSDFLVAAINGEIDLDELARKELASRGLDRNGVWVGFDEAKEIHNVK